MNKTERLYYTDSHLTEFDARIVAVSHLEGERVGVTLDRTAFYPTGGGQPSDTGSLDEARVVECVDKDAAGVLHVLEGVAPPVGARVRGRIDWPRRLDHLQQHTGQHILSQAFVQLFGAQTRSFRMLERVSEIDVALDAPTTERIEQAVELANRVIWENRPVNVLQVRAEEAQSLPLRKDSAREGELRVVEIEGYDMSPCGGTHAAHTGEVGIIAVRSWERAKGLTRLEFLAGRRVVADYTRANATARHVAALFSVGRDDAHAAVARLIDDNKQLARRLHALEEVAARVEAQELLAAATRPKSDAFRIITRIFDGRDAESLKRLGSSIASHPSTIALLGSRDGHNARLLFARSPDAPGDMNALMRQACALLDGRGGGRPDLAQGGGRRVENLQHAIEAAARILHDG